MLIDQNVVFTDGAITASVVSDPVALTSLLMPGKQEPIPLLVQVTETFNNLTSLGIKMQQSDTKDGTYADLDDTGATFVAAQLKAGTKLGWRFVPRAATKSWLKLAYTVTGTAPTKGQLFVALMREDAAPYEAGQYITAGKVQG